MLPHAGKHTEESPWQRVMFAGSVLETERSLVLAEKGSGDNDDVELIRAAAGFRLVATMNPGGDFGKKEVRKRLVHTPSRGRGGVWTACSLRTSCGRVWLLRVCVSGQLSPALRNRFTEIWCPQSNSRSDLVQIIQHNLRSGLSLDGKVVDNDYV